jgi:hypothetical protein
MGKKNIFFASLKSLKKGVGSGSAPTCHGSPTLVSKKFMYTTTARPCKDIKNKGEKVIEKHRYGSVRASF